MSEAVLSSPGLVASDGERFSQHRDCVNCGYDLFAQPLRGVCPECAAKVNDTASEPLWSATDPRRLARSRLGLRLLAVSLLTMLCVAVAGLLLSILGVDEAGETVAVVITLGALLTVLVGLVLFGIGVGSRGWKRWAPLCFAAVLAAWIMAGEAAVEQEALWLGPSVSLTLVWLFGVSLQALVRDVSRGVASRPARVRSARMLKVSRLMLFSTAAVSWGATVFMALAGEGGFLYFFGFTLIAIQGMAALVAVWVLIVSIHWLRLLRLWKR